MAITHFKPKETQERSSVIIPRAVMASGDVGSRPSRFMIIPNTKRQFNMTKTDQFPSSEVITGVPRPYHNIDIRQEERRGMCSDTLNPDGEVSGCCVGFMLGMLEISPFAFIAASCQLHGISRSK